MFNSIHIRDILLKANQSPMYTERRNPHRRIAQDPDAAPAPEEFLVAGEWRFKTNLPNDIARVVEEDITDFLGYFHISINECSSGTIQLLVTEDIGKRDFRFNLSPNNIKLEGGGIAGIWAGVSWLEREMRVRRAPILPQGMFNKPALWDMQISQGPWGGNYSVPDFSSEYLSDDSFRLYAHYGINSMMIYGDLLCYINSSILPELNCEDYSKDIEMLKNASKRAKRYGIQFSYVPVGPKLRPEHPVFKNHPEVRGAGVQTDPLLHFLCSSNSTVLKFYEETFENLFREVPELAGVILITFSESFYHCRIWDKRTQVACPSCNTQPINSMVARLVNTVAEGVKKGNPDAFVAMWIYTWPHGDRRKAFNDLASDIAVFHHIEKDEQYKKNGYTKRIWDYSIDFQGPSKLIKELAEYTHAKERKLFVKTEVGIGLEVIQFPYVPAMQHLAEKFSRVRSLRPYGVHQSWLFFGMFGSRAEELGFWAAYEPDEPYANFLKRMAMRDFGAPASKSILEAWQHMSDAVTHLPCLILQHYYIGPSFLGPAHPLMPSANTPVPEIFHAHLFYKQEHEESLSRKALDQSSVCLVMRELPPSSKKVGVIPDDPRSDGWSIVAHEYALAASEAFEAYKKLKSTQNVARTLEDSLNIQEETMLTELVFRTFKTCENTVRFLRARHEMETTNNPQAKDKMIRIATAEKQNTLKAKRIYKQTPWLDLANRLDGQFSSCVDMIDEKVRLIRDIELDLTDI